LGACSFLDGSISRLNALPFFQGMGVNCVNVTSNDNLQEIKLPMLETHDKKPQLTPALTHTGRSVGSQNKEMHNIISGSK